MYKLDINQELINQAVEIHLNNIGDPSATDANDSDKKMIQDFANSINVFYDDDPQYNRQSFFYAKHHDDNLHHWYKILITSKENKKFRLYTEIGLPENSFRQEEFNLSSVITALSFEVADPRDYMQEPEDSAEYKKALKRYNKNDKKIWNQFGESFYSCILGGSY